MNTVLNSWLLGPMLFNGEGMFTTVTEAGRMKCLGSLLPRKGSGVEFLLSFCGI